MCDEFSTYEDVRLCYVLRVTIRSSDSNFRLFLHALAPSGLGLLIYVLIGLGMVCAHIISLGASGIAYPNSTNDTFMVFYANNILSPILRTLNNGTFNSGMTIIMWGAAGWIVYTIIALISRAFSGWEEAEHDITLTDRGAVVRHPMQHSVIVRAMLRLGIGVLCITFILAVLPLIHWCFENDERILLHISQLGRVAVLGLINVAAWMVIQHGFVVFLRLYLFRTRVFGELLY